jgi:hypothetical protein
MSLLSGAGPRITGFLGTGVTLPALPPSVRRMFASNTLTEHLARGFVGIGLLVAATLLSSAHPVLALMLVAPALFSLRGCPMCWTMGLGQTLVAKLRGKPAADFCRDGRCTVEGGGNTAGSATL